MGGGEQVEAAHHVGDALLGIVDRHGEMIGGRRVLAGEDDVAERFGAARTSSPSLRQVSGPVRAIAAATSRRQAWGRDRSASEAPGTSPDRAAPPARAARRPRRRYRRGCRSRDRRGPWPSAAPAPRHRDRAARTGRPCPRPIRGRARADPRGSRRQTRSVTRPGSISSILQQEGAVAVAREIMGPQRRISVAQMQPSGGTWREAGDDVHEDS